MKLFEKNHLLTLAFIFFCFPALHSQSCFFFDDYSNPALWTQIGTGVEVSNGKLRFDNARDQKYQKRVFRELGVPLSECDVWSLEFEFTPTQLGNWSGTNDAAGHVLAALTAGTKGPFSDCSCNHDCSNCGYPVSDQDAVICHFASKQYGGHVGFTIFLKDGQNETESSARIPLPANWQNTTYYLRMERPQKDFIRLSVFSDPGRLQHIPDSPIQIAISGTISGLSHIQHSNTPRGWYPRNLWGEVDNLCLNLSRDDNADLEFSVFPNPTSGSVSVAYSNCCDRPVYIHLVDEKGNLIDYQDRHGNGIATFDLYGLEAGVYYIQIGCKEWFEWRKFIIVESDEK